ncbi:hypothetical protein IQ22_02943 [Pseudomonas duriflava]|uniref:Chromosome partitioning protein ParA n=1 Tax=Pseudomonas duriflava TaxID=459528 RepID=A0A562QAA7_9PSED|nr:chromosome partitioning protein ParA [Pseudomonas duriflava]TWI53100.1 hypothetical protein IQ22_02943 [Pseudomonas duriflava]
MSTVYKSQKIEVVAFFDEKEIVKEMFFHEFEALLDGVFTLPSFSGKRVRLAYAVIDSQLCIRAAVFFYLEFSRSGAPDPQWNIPLRDLAERAGRGPDLGAGPIRLACRSQCPVPWHQPGLWDPILQAGHNDLFLLRECTRRNQLGLPVVAPVVKEVKTEHLNLANEHHWYVHEAEPAKSPFDSTVLEREHQAKMEHLVRQQRLRILALTRKHEGELRQLQQENDALKAALAEEQRYHAELAEQLAQQAAQYRSNRHELTQQLRALEKNAEYKVEALKIQFEAEQQARIEAAVADYKEQLAIREVELSYREELDTQLEEELAQLKARCTTLEANAGKALIDKMSSRGVVFVTYQPGAGHMTLASDAVLRFVEHPTSYIAAQCQLSEDQYECWLSHYKRPVCQGVSIGGKLCSAPIPRVESPQHFVAGESDCCERHQVSLLLKNQAG